MLQTKVSGHKFSRGGFRPMHGAFATMQGVRTYQEDTFHQDMIKSSEQHMSGMQSD
jgi:hypothetical protein